MAQISYGSITITDVTDIANVVNWYLASSSSSGVTIETSGWTSDPTSQAAQMTSTNQYLWNYEQLLGTGNVEIRKTTPCIIGRYGQNGAPGNNGVSITGITEHYAIGGVSKPSSSSFSTTIVSPTASQRYLWNYQVIQYSNNTTSGGYDDARVIGVYGDRGQRGTALLKITTEPTAYTTTQGGFTPSYRVALNTVTSESGQSEVLVGDVIEYNYNHYQVGYVSSNYVYLGPSTNLNGINTATIYLYQRGTTSTAPTKPSVNLTYTFSTATLTPASGLAGWVQNIGNIQDGSYPIWVISAVANSNTNVDIITSNEWSNQIKLAQDGASGQPGYNQSTIYLYQRSAETPNKPSATLTYTFSTGELTGSLGNWTREIPTSNGHPCYVISVSAISQDATSSIVSSAWTNPVVLVEDGTDGRSPTVTPVASGVQIYDPTSGQTYTITNGVNGQTYYTHIMYSSKLTPTSASDVSSSPDGKSYVGIQTTTQQAAPAWNDSNWHWVKYVGTDGSPGQPGTNGVSVSSVREVYYLTTQVATPSTPVYSDTDPSTSTPIYSDDRTENWTTVVPGYVENGRYYVSLETTLSSGSKVFSTATLDQALTTSNYNAWVALSTSSTASTNASSALSIAQGLNQHYWFNPADYVSTGVTLPAGAYVTQAEIDSFKSNPTGGSVLTRSDGILLNKDKYRAMALTSSALAFYEPGRTLINSSDTAYVNALLDSNGLVLKKGGIVAGTYDSSASDVNQNYVYLSSIDHPVGVDGVTIGNFTPTSTSEKWRQVIGTKFGVTNAGTLYASNAHIEGAITATSLTIGSGNDSYSGIAAMNIAGYSIEIELSTSGISNPDLYVYLIPHLYHNGILADSEVTDKTKFKWYQDDSSSATLGRASDGAILASRSHSYRVTYEFNDGAVGGGVPIEPVIVEPSMYITNLDNTGIKVHPKNWETNSTYLQIDGSGVYIKDSNDVSLAEFNAVNARIGKSNNTRFVLGTNSLQAYDNNNVKYFEVSASGLSYGSTAVASQASVATAQQNAQTYTNNKVQDVSYSIEIKVNAIDFANNSATLEAIPYYQGSTILPSGVTHTYQWYKGSTALVNTATAPTISGATTTTLVLGTGSDLEASYVCVISKS